MNDIKREGTLVFVNSVSVELFSYGSNDRSAKNGGYNHQIGTIIDSKLIDNHILQMQIGGLQYIKLIALMYFFLVLFFRKFLKRIGVKTSFNFPFRK